MAELRLRRQGSSDFEDLPEVCVCCGAPATTHIRMQSNIPRARIRFPVCNRCKSRWRPYHAWVTWIVILGTIAVGAASFVRLFPQPVFYATVVVAGIVLFCMPFIPNGFPVYAHSSTSEDLLLRGVDEKFVVALEELRNNPASGTPREDGPFW
jgi:hypothetical protein